MYRIEPLPPLPPTPQPMSRPDGTYGAVDRVRGLVVRYIGAYREPMSHGWLFQAGDALVPFDFSERLVSDPAGPAKAMTLDSFGVSSVVGWEIGIGRYDFASDEQKREWSLLAVEGALVAKTYRNRRRKVSHRMEALGRSWTVEDFGYPVTGADYPTEPSEGNRPD